MMISTHDQVCPCFNKGHSDFLRVFCKIKTFLKIEIQTLVHFLLLGMINFYFVNSFSRKMLQILQALFASSDQSKTIFRRICKHKKTKTRLNLNQRNIYNSFSRRTDLFDLSLKQSLAISFKYFVSDSEMFYDGAKRFLNRDLN